MVGSINQINLIFFNNRHGVIDENDMSIVVELQHHLF